MLELDKECFIRSSGEANLGKFKINDVSSHYTNRKFIFCIYCIENKNKSKERLREDCEIFVDPKEIKPLILTNIRVKAKK